MNPHNNSNFNDRVKRVLEEEMTDVMRLFLDSTHTSGEIELGDGSGLLPLDTKTEVAQGLREIRHVRRLVDKERKDNSTTDYSNVWEHLWWWITTPGAELDPAVVKYLIMRQTPFFVEDPSRPEGFRVTNPIEFSKWVREHWEEYRKTVEAINPASDGNPQTGPLSDIVTEIEDLVRGIKEVYDTYKITRIYNKLVECCENMGTSMQHLIEGCEELKSKIPPRMPGENYFTPPSVWWV